MSKEHKSSYDQDNKKVWGINTQKNSETFDPETYTSVK